MKTLWKLAVMTGLLALCACMHHDKPMTDCSTVRCAACPEGQRPALTPPDCCKCIPG